MRFFCILFNKGGPIAISIGTLQLTHQYESGYTYSCPYGIPPFILRGQAWQIDWISNKSAEAICYKHRSKIHYEETRNPISNRSFLLLMDSWRDWIVSNRIVLYRIVFVMNRDIIDRIKRINTVNRINKGSLIDQCVTYTHVHYSKFAFRAMSVHVCCWIKQISGFVAIF